MAEITYDAATGTFTVTLDSPNNSYFFTITDTAGRQIKAALHHVSQTIDVSGLKPGVYELRVFGRQSTNSPPDPAPPEPGEEPTAALDFEVVSADVPSTTPTGPPPQVVRLERTAAAPTDDDVLSIIIENWTTARLYNAYHAYVERQFCAGNRGNVFAPKAYERLYDHTRTFLRDLVPAAGHPGEVPVRVDRAGLVDKYFVSREDRQVLPYIETILRRFPDALSGDACSDIDPAILTEPLPVELIWSYWHEEGGLVQTLNLILARFQNRRVRPGPDPLARFDLSPLRPLRHLLWEWAEDETNRITVRRRDAEYRYQYGLALMGRAVPHEGLFVEQRARFLEAFHTLLHVCHVFFRQDDDTTVQADAFPVLNALRETHLILAEGAHNQFGDLPTEARIQMLIMQWLLAQPEMRDFLGGRPMVPYEEPWMDRVDSMRSIQGWNDTSVTYFRDLGVYGEQLLLSIRLGNWNSEIRTDSAKAWARRWRPQIQRYTHAYRAATGVDLTDPMAGVNATMPSVLLARRKPTRRHNA